MAGFVVEGLLFSVEVGLVVAGETGKFGAVEVDDAGGDFFEEGAVVGDED